jgi:hypothetical protein
MRAAGHRELIDAQPTHRCPELVGKRVRDVREVYPNEETDHVLRGAYLRLI